MDPLSIGRECYKKKDFEGALKAFTEGVNISTGHILLTALDHRAATLEKLGKLQAALKDAKDMIELEPGLAKGYLRCAKILQLKGEENLALKIYERGLGKVKVGKDLDRPILQDMFTRLQRKQIPTRNFDPMIMLPPELAQMVCSHLDMRDRVICLAVSRPWKRFLESSHDLWTVLDLRSARRLVRLDSLKAHLRRSNYDLNTAFLNMSPQILGDRGLEIITRFCKKLSYLEITFNGSLGTSLVSALPRAQNLRDVVVKDAELTLLSVRKILISSPRLQRAEFFAVRSIGAAVDFDWPQLESLKCLRLELLANCFVDPFRLRDLISRTPNLRTAILIQKRMINDFRISYSKPDFSLWTQLEHLEFNYSQLPLLPPFPVTLKVLDISKTFTNQLSLSPVGIATTPHLPLLETLACQQGSVNLESIIALIGPSVKARNLRTLNMGFPLGDDDEKFTALPDDFTIPSLQELSISQCQGSETDILRFLRRCPSLRNLDASSTQITGVAVKELMTRDNGPLKWLGVNKCPHLSPDAVEWARSLGTTVQYSQNQEMKPAGKRSFRDRFMGVGV